MSHGAILGSCAGATVGVLYVQYNRNDAVMRQVLRDLHVFERVQRRAELQQPIAASSFDGLSWCTIDNIASLETRNCDSVLDAWYTAPFYTKFGRVDYCLTPKQHFLMYIDRADKVKSLFE